jgi:hypothetical protein
LVLLVTFRLKMVQKIKTGALMIANS